MDEKVQCPKCGTEKVFRLERIGLLQKHILPRFGRYPWSCKVCRTSFYSFVRWDRRKRKKYHSADKTDASSGNPDLSNMHGYLAGHSFE